MDPDWECWLCFKGVSKAYVKAQEKLKKVETRYGRNTICKYVKCPTNRCNGNVCIDSIDMYDSMLY